MGKAVVSSSSTDTADATQHLEKDNECIEYVPVWPVQQADLKDGSEALPIAEHLVNPAGAIPYVVAKGIAQEAQNSYVTRPDRDLQVAISGGTVIQQAVVKLLALARREVLFILPSMHELFNDESIVQGLIDFTRGSAQRDTLLIINNLAEQQASNHLLVKLAQRLSSRIQLKQTSSLLEPPVMDTDYLVIIDRSHILRIDDIERYHAWFDINYASRARQYADSLLQQWPRAQEVAEFRQFIL